jgi:hypothetical protein
MTNKIQSDSVITSSKGPNKLCRYKRGVCVVKVKEIISRQNADLKAYYLMLTAKSDSNLNYN